MQNHHFSSVNPVFMVNSPRKTAASSRFVPVIPAQAGDKRAAAAAALTLAEAQLLNQQPDDAMSSAEEARSL